jgi:hypothetical protein
MKAKWTVTGTTFAMLMCAVAATASEVTKAGNSGTIAESQRLLAKIIPGQSTKADVQALLGTPWRIVQFNDCGMAMDDQADETWEYRGADANGGYRFHVEFGDNKVVHLTAKVPDNVPGGKAVVAKVAPGVAPKGMSM